MSNTKCLKKNATHYIIYIEQYNLRIQLLQKSLNSSYKKNSQFTTATLKVPNRIYHEKKPLMGGNLEGFVCRRQLRNNRAKIASRAALGKLGRRAPERDKNIPKRGRFWKKSTQKKESHGVWLHFGVSHTIYPLSSALSPAAYDSFPCCEFFRVGDNVRFSEKRYDRISRWFIMCVCKIINGLVWFFKKIFLKYKRILSV